MAGINETKDVVLAAVALGNSISKSLADHKIGISDLPGFLDPLMKLPSAFAGIRDVPAELKDLDETEKAELIQAVKDNFDFEDDQIEELVEDSLRMVGLMHGFVQKHF